MADRYLSYDNTVPIQINNQTVMTKFGGYFVNVEDVGHQKDGVYVIPPLWMTVWIDDKIKLVVPAITR